MGCIIVKRIKGYGTVSRKRSVLTGEKPIDSSFGSGRGLMFTSRHTELIPLIQFVDRKGIGSLIKMKNGISEESTSAAFVELHEYFAKD